MARDHAAREGRLRHGWRLAFALLLVAYMLPGLLGHQPWKPDEPYTFGVVRDMLASGDWIVPAVGGVPFVEKPPLFYWIAAGITRVLAGMLPPHDAARLATALFVALTLATTAIAARLCWGPAATMRAMLLLLATLGLEGHAQRLQVDVALMAGFAVAVLGLAALARERPWGGAVLGLGAGLGFLAKGLLAPAALALAALLLPVLFPDWRRGTYARQLAVAMLVASPALVAWPLALWQRDAALFHAWLWDNNIGRFLGFSVEKLGATSERGFWPQTLPWFLFPLWIYVAGALHAERARLARLPGMQVGLVLSGVMLATLLASASGRAIYALPLLPPLALVAVVGVREHEGVVARSFAHACIAITVVLAAGCWGVWGMLATSHDLPRWLGLRELFPLPFAMPFSPGLVAAAVALTLGYAALVAMRRRLPLPSLTLWVGSVTLAWGLAMTLWLPWLDAAKGYRDVFTQARPYLPDGARCMFVVGLGESERAMAEYYLPPPLRAQHGRESGECPVLLWRGKAEGVQHPLGPSWQRVWEGSRAGEMAERFRLFVRSGAK